ncbi:ATP-binding cassette domain-containing protein [Bradyrhizobium sp. CSA207]|uniref:ABC transporter ATP-binding protein n=1 Tax=Bradyrhizobium sp. CSA207 TaxID=2698826 RepID=UPI0023B13705|nr:ABC transporter ATP-binding protein [Bradyrhizobium sp. CSA207]MDE5444341.1 ATP-binding cassette domain-containing protein [Bradyrhizobium sp. CSA207]
MLDVKGLQVRYGTVLGVDGLDLHVNQGEIVVLIGANGAGKSSTVNAIAGLVRPVAGLIKFRDADMGKLDAAARVEHGMALVIEGRGVFSEMTVRENLELGAYSRPAIRSAALRRAADHAIAMFPRLGDRFDQAAGTLSGGEQQMLAIARALMSSPKLLVLDEPSLGLAPRIVDEIAERLTLLSSEEGVTILIAEQNASLGLDIAKRGYILQNGRIALEGTAPELHSNTDLIRFYLGGQSYVRT